MVRSALALTIALLGTGVSPAAGETPADTAPLPELRAYLGPGDHADLRAELDRLAAGVADRVGRERAAIRDLLAREVAVNLRAKQALRSPDDRGFALTSGDIRRTVLGYEAFKLETYLGSGVFPKRYFGYLDRRWDTAAAEEILLELVPRSVALINAHQEARGRPVRLSDLDVLATYLSEGGATILLLEHHRKGISDPRARVIDLYVDIGIDNIGLALREYPGLATELDQALDTALAPSGTKEGRNELGTYVGLDRRVSFRESIVATSLMLLYEKERAARLLAKQGPSRGWSPTPLGRLPLDEQFIVASLVFNSGLIFERSSVEAIRDLSARGYLRRVSDKTSARTGPRHRPALPVPASLDDALRGLREDGYPHQPTSWSAAYHVLQRYGAWKALSDLTDHFDAEGFLRPPP